MLLFGFCVCATNHWLKIPGPQGPWVSIEIVVVKRSAAAVAPPLLSWIFKGQNHQVFYGELLSLFKLVPSVPWNFCSPTRKCAFNSLILCSFSPFFKTLCFPCFSALLLSIWHPVPGPNLEILTLVSKYFWSKLPLQNSNLFSVFILGKKIFIVFQFFKKTLNPFIILGNIFYRFSILRKIIDGFLVNKEKIHSELS